MKSTLFSLSFCLLLWGCSCKKESNEPEKKKPEPTTDGRNTFYCEINGVPYYQEFKGGWSQYPKIIGAAESYPGFTGFSFRAEYERSNGNEDVIFFDAINIFQTGIYNVDSSNGNVLIRFNDHKGCRYIDADYFNTMSGRVDFSRYDFGARIFSGTFECKNWLPDLVRGNCDTIKITNGIFDLKL